MPAVHTGYSLCSSVIEITTSIWSAVTPASVSASRAACTPIALVWSSGPGTVLRVMPNLSRTTASGTPEAAAICAAV
jgi:hypothetical protein